MGDGGAATHNQGSPGLPTRFRERGLGDAAELEGRQDPAKPASATDTSISWQEMRNISLWDTQPMNQARPIVSSRLWGASSCSQPPPIVICFAARPSYKRCRQDLAALLVAGRAAKQRTMAGGHDGAAQIEWLGVRGRDGCHQQPSSPIVSK